MIIERSEFEVVAGREEEFLRYLEANRKKVEGFAGCRSFNFGRGVESPSKFILLLIWDSVEAHERVTRQPDFIAMGEKMAPFIADGKMEHFNSPGWK